MDIIYACIPSANSDEICLEKGKSDVNSSLTQQAEKKTGEGSRSNVLAAVCSEIIVGLFDQLEFESNHFDLCRAHNVMIHLGPNDY